MGNIHWAQLLIVAVIVLVIFGSKKLRNLGGDVGESVKGFKKAMSDDDSTQTSSQTKESADELTTNKPKDNDQA